MAAIPAHPADRSRRLVDGVVLIALPLLMLLPGAAGWLTAPLMIAGLVLILRHRQLTSTDRRFLLVSSLIPLAALVNLAVFGGGASVMERPGHLIRGFLIYYAVSRLGLSRTALVGGTVLAALVAAAIAVHSALFLHELRVYGFRGHWNAVPFGNFSLLMGILALAAVLLPAEASRPWERPAAAVACLLGLAASLLSGSRGGWLSLPLLLPALIWLCPPHRRRRWSSVVALLAVISAIGLATVPSARDRLIGGVAEIGRYWNDPNSLVNMSSNTGQRLAMWRWGLERFADHPLLGFGIANFPRERAEAVKQGKLPALIDEARLANVHNELIGSLATGGLLGAGALLAFWVLGWRFYRGRLAGRSDQRYFAACGLLTLLATAAFSMTEGLFGTGPGTKALMLLLALPAGGLAYCERLRA